MIKACNLVLRRKIVFEKPSLPQKSRHEKKMRKVTFVKHGKEAVFRNTEKKHRVAGSLA